MEKIEIEMNDTVLGDISIVMPSNYEEYIGEDGFNYSHSNITGMVMDSNNNIVEYIRWSAWSYPQYRYEYNNGYGTSYGYNDLLRNNTEIVADCNYNFYGSEEHQISRNPNIIYILMAIILSAILIVLMFKGRN